MKFQEIDQDPWVNASSDFYYVLGIRSIGVTPEPSSVGRVIILNGTVLDPQSNTVDVYSLYVSYDWTQAGSLSDEAFAHSWQNTHRVLIPPGYSMASFGVMYGFFMTFDEVVEMVKHGGLR